MKFRLTAVDGRTVGPVDWIGRPTIVFFGFTWCPDICPTTLANISGWLDALGPPADRLNVAFVTVDSERDTRRACRVPVGLPSKDLRLHRDAGGNRAHC